MKDFVDERKYCEALSLIEDLIEFIEGDCEYKNSRESVELLDKAKELIGGL